MQNDLTPSMSAAPQLAIVIPCYNEESVLPETYRRITALLTELAAAGRIAEVSRVYFVDDGSRDRTWELIEQFGKADTHVAGIKLSRNCGHQNALLAGLFTATGDAVVSIDADLQDDVDAIREMVERFHSGAEIVYGVRRRRDTDSVFKRSSAEWFYALLRALGVETVQNHADYRLLSRRAVDDLKQYREVNLYLRGIIPLLGYSTAVVQYDRARRFAGESKYPLRRMVALALDAITSFSVVPLRLIAVLGFVVFAGTLLVMAWALWVRYFTSNAVPGWTSVVLPIYFLGGVQLLSFGVLGEYLGKIYAETKQRPRYFVEALLEGGSDGAATSVPLKRNTEALA